MSKFTAYFDALVFSFDNQKEYYLRRINKFSLTIKERETFEAYLANLATRKFTTSQEALEKMRDSKYFDEAQFYFFAIIEKNPEMQAEAEVEFNKQLALLVPSYRPKDIKKLCLWHFDMYYYTHVFCKTNKLQTIVDIGSSMMHSFEFSTRIPENIRKYWYNRITKEYPIRYEQSPDDSATVWFM